jgi:adenosine deaminase
VNDKPSTESREEHQLLPLEFFQKLPKTDLHVHLDGSLRLETIVDLAAKDRAELPTRDAAELGRIMGIGQNCGSLEKYLEAFDITLRVMQTEESLYRVAYELAADAAKENVRYMEVRYSPMLHTRRGLRITSVVEAVLAGLRAAHDDLGIESAIIICGIRNISPESSLEMAELAVAYKGRGVVGFDLAGAEYDHPAKHHKAAFQLVRDNNINCTIHAGEAYGPESIAQACTCAARTASATAAACARTATSYTTSTTTASRSSVAPRRTCRRAPCATSRRTRCASITTSACASR